MRPTHLVRLRRIADKLNTAMDDVMNLGGIPDGHDLERQATSHIAAIYDILEKIPQNASNRQALESNEPLVYGVVGTDMRNWPTTRRGRALRLSSKRNRIASIGAPLIPSGSVPRVMTASQYNTELMKTVSRRSRATV